jgi:hypothetical protein
MFRDHLSPALNPDQTTLPCAMYIGYLALRSAEAMKLGFVTYAVIGQWLPACTLAFLFLFALSVVVAGVHHLGEGVALVWHVILEVMLLPLSVYFAYLAAADLKGSFAASPFSMRFAIMLAVFLTLQSLLALAGCHVLRWAAGEASVRQRS